MEPIAILHADPLDILFENRNKAYGAYPLRKYYAQRLLISLGCTFSLIIVSSLAWYYFQTPPLMIREFVIPDTKIADIQPPPKPISAPSKSAAPKPPASIQNVTMVIVADRKAIKPIATIDELKTSSIGLKTIAGISDNGEMNSNGNSGAGTGEAKTDSVANKPEIFERAEVMPEFPGGIEALKRYLIKNLRMPENSLESGAQVRVMARFVVGADGRVRDIQITQAAEDVFNVEVKRVISKMPDWKPGVQNHHPVAVYFSLPVNFVNAE